MGEKDKTNEKYVRKEEVAREYDGKVRQKNDLRTFQPIGKQRQEIERHGRR